jgi:hypothetical protein
MLTHLALKDQSNIIELCKELFGFCLFLRRAAHCGCLHLLDEALLAGVASMASFLGKR